MGLRSSLDGELRDHGKGPLSLRVRRVGCRPAPGAGTEHPHGGRRRLCAGCFQGRTHRARPRGRASRSGLLGGYPRCADEEESRAICRGTAPAASSEPHTVATQITHSVFRAHTLGNDLGTCIAFPSYPMASSLKEGITPSYDNDD